MGVVLNRSPFLLLFLLSGAHPGGSPQVSRGSKLSTSLLFTRETDEETDGEKIETKRDREGARDIKRGGRGRKEMGGDKIKT